MSCMSSASVDSPHLDLDYSGLFIIGWGFGPERFRVPKTYFQEHFLANDAFQLQLSIKRVGIFAKWQRLREVN